MELRNFRPLIILGAVIVVLLFAVLIIKLANSGTETKSDQPEQKKTVKINYPTVSDTEEEILSKIYNPDRDYYTGFTNQSGEKENIFGNKKEITARNFDQKTRMGLALNTFDISDLEKINCNTITWDSSWNSSWYCCENCCWYS